MLCAVNLFLFKPHKNIRKLIVLFSSLYVDFGLWCEFFVGIIVGWCSPSFDCISTIKMLQQSNLKLNIFETYSDEKEDTALASIIEK